MDLPGVPGSGGKEHLGGGVVRILLEEMVLVGPDVAKSRDDRRPPPRPARAGPSGARTRHPTGVATAVRRLGRTSWYVCPLCFGWKLCCSAGSPAALKKAGWNVGAAFWIEHVPSRALERGRRMSGNAKEKAAPDAPRPPTSTILCWVLPGCRSGRAHNTGPGPRFAVSWRGLPLDLNTAALRRHLQRGAAGRGNSGRIVSVFGAFTNGIAAGCRKVHVTAVTDIWQTLGYQPAGLQPPYRLWHRCESQRSQDMLSCGGQKICRSSGRSRRKI